MSRRTPGSGGCSGKHLGARDPLFGYLRARREAFPGDLQARATLNRAIKAKAEEVFDAPLLCWCGRDPCLHPALVWVVGEEVTRRAVGEGASDLRERVRAQDHEIDEPRTDTFIASGLTDHETAVEILEDLTQTMTRSSEAEQAAQRHRALEAATRRAKSALEETTSWFPTSGALATYVGHWEPADRGDPHTTMGGKERYRLAYR